MWIDFFPPSLPSWSYSRFLSIKSKLAGGGGCGGGYINKVPFSSVLHVQTHPNGPHTWAAPNSSATVKTVTRQWKSNYRQGSNLVNKDHISDRFFFSTVLILLSQGEAEGKKTNAPVADKDRPYFSTFVSKEDALLKIAPPFFSPLFISYINFLPLKLEEKNGSPSFPHLILPQPLRTLPQRLYFVFYLCDSTLNTWITIFWVWFWWNGCEDLLIRLYNSNLKVFQNIKHVNLLLISA